MTNNDEDDVVDETFEDVGFDKVTRNVDRLLEDLKKEKESKQKIGSMDRIRMAHDIRTDPPKPGFMKVDVSPAVYSIDLNTDAHWWFNHSCTVFPLLLDQAKRTHMDLKDSFKMEKRMPDFNFMWIFIIVIGLIGIFLGTKFMGLW